jgi:RHS repeat-associated protein
LAAGLPQQLSDGGTLFVPGVGQHDGTAWTYQLTDALGSVRQLADAQGYVVQRYDYGPFGETLKVEGKKSNTLRYTGEQTDNDTGLVYLRARWYDAMTGRFTTRDPFPGLPILPQTLHPYVYVNNNPINLTDPSGEFVGDILDIASFFWSLDDFLRCPTWENAAWLGVDLLGLLPVIPALGMVRKIGKLGDVGQLHHMLSNKIVRALGQHQTLRGLLSRNDLIVRATDTLSHKGYQTWHRLYDNEVVQWLSRHPNASHDDFLQFLREIYERPEMREAFPDALNLLK